MGPWAHGPMMLIDVLHGLLFNIESMLSYLGCGEYKIIIPILLFSERVAFDHSADVFLI